MILAIIRGLIYISLLLLITVILDVIIWNLSGVSFIDYFLTEAI